MRHAEEVQTRGEVIAIVEHADGSVDIYRTRNLVGDAGDVYYAESGAGETPTNTFNTLELGTGGDAPAKGSDRSNMTSKVSGSQEAVDVDYPKTDDDDSDNTGAAVDVVSWRFSYAKGDPVAANIDRGIITITSPGADEDVLTYFTFAASFSVTADDTLKVFVNHTMNGV